MLVMTRLVGENIVIGEGPARVLVKVVKIDGQRVQIGVQAAREIPVDREEVLGRAPKAGAHTSSGEAETVGPPGQGDMMGGVFGPAMGEDPLLNEAVRVAIREGGASVSMLQRRMCLGFVRASRLIDLMKNAGVLGDLIAGTWRYSVQMTPAEWDATRAPVAAGSEVRP